MRAAASLSSAPGAGTDRTSGRACCSSLTPCRSAASHARLGSAPPSANPKSAASEEPRAAKKEPSSARIPAERNTPDHPVSGPWTWVRLPALPRHTGLTRRGMPPGNLTGNGGSNQSPVSSRTKRPVAVTRSPSRTITASKSMIPGHLRLGASQRSGAFSSDVPNPRRSSQAKRHTSGCSSPRRPGGRCPEPSETPMRPRPARQRLRRYGRSACPPLFGSSRVSAMPRAWATRSATSVWSRPRLCTSALSRMYCARPLAFVPA